MLANIYWAASVMILFNQSTELFYTNI